MIEDKLLIWRLKSGDSSALASVYEKYKNCLLKIAIGLLNQGSAAEDIVHDVFVSLAQSCDKLKLSGNLKGYLAVSVANHARNINKKIQIKQKARPEQSETGIRNQDKPEQWIVHNEQLNKLNNALAELPYSQREIILLHMHGGMKFAAIAKSQDISINTAQSRYRYGLDKLRSLLNGEVKK